MSRLERETYLFPTENYIFALKWSTNTKKVLRVGRVSGNKQLFLRLTL